MVRLPAVDMSTSRLTPQTIAAARRRDPDALVELYRALSDPVYAYLLRNTRDPAWAADLTADVFVEVLTSISRFSGTPDGLRAWVFRIARNTMLDHFRKQSRRMHDRLEDAQEAGTLPPDHPDSLEDRVVSTVERDRILALVDTLSPDQREVVLLRLVADLSIADVARITGKTPGAVKALQRRGFQAIGRLVEREGVPL